MANNILDPSALISTLPTILPSSTSKNLSSQNDGLAALVHTIFTVLAFRLVAMDDAATTSLPEGNLLPDDWNKNGPGHYTFKYKHDQSSLEFVIKVSKLGSRTLINAIALESDKVATLDISTDDFTSKSFYPCDVAVQNQALVHGFISSHRVSDLTTQLKLKIISKLIPGLRKDGYAENDASTASTSTTPRRPVSDPSVPDHEPNPTGPDRIPYTPRSAFPRNPLEIGRSDLDPFPINPFSPPSLFPHAGGDGMFLGPNHPIFSGRRGPSTSPFSGPWGGDGYLPPMGAPPGARFDPVGPFSPDARPVPGFPGQQPRRTGEPDNDEFMPPGMVRTSHIATRFLLSLLIATLRVTCLCEDSRNGIRRNVPNSSNIACSRC
ncbi:PI31 proteasome regulator N-terminal-domain-containing protein [Panaeolus papilionaceus]|nr:PI31 proteasome regulator N-terminal-domain-containing protein [Panaeolus papilionaceus]